MTHRLPYFHFSESKAHEPVWNTLYRASLSPRLELHLKLLIPPMSTDNPSVMDVKRDGIAAYVTPGSSRRDDHFPVGRSDAVTHFGVHRL